MINFASGNKLLLKAICMAVTCAFGVGLLAADALAIDGCGLKCCCQSKPLMQHQTQQEQIRSAMGCCAGSTQMPCDLAQATELKLPDLTLASAAGHTPGTVGPASGLSNALIDRYDLGGLAFDYFARENFRSPPLYLQNLSFLI
jgi:hypothetical protein